MGRIEERGREGGVPGRPAAVARVRILTEDEADVVPISGIDVLVGRSAADHLDAPDGSSAPPPDRAPRSATPPTGSPVRGGFAAELRDRISEGTDALKTGEIHLDHVETVAAYYAALTNRSRRGRR